MEKVSPFIPLQEETHSADFLSRLQGDESVGARRIISSLPIISVPIKQKGCRLVCIERYARPSTMWLMS
ncbi:MAG: hypothetical protein ACLUVY_08965 [Bacteroides uniformis]